VSDVVKDGADVTTSYSGAILLDLRKPFHLKWLSRAADAKIPPSMSCRENSLA
jgi:hypothetical protein